MKRGFTLVELLAVIVLLAIIALIAVPIVAKIIKDSRESARLRSAELYEASVENAVLKVQSNGDVLVEDGTYTVQSNGSICMIESNACVEGTTIEVDMDGDYPTSGTVVIKDGLVESSDLYINGVEIRKSNGGYTTDKLKTKYENGEAVYFDVTNGKTCNATDATSATGTKSGCMKFYAFNDDETSTTVNLILDHNTTTTVEFDSINGNTSLGPNEVLSVLKSDTSSWKGTVTPENYSSSAYTYTINYNDEEYKARLIEAQEIAQIVGNTTWNVATANTNWFYLDSKNQTQTANSTNKSKYAWLFDYTSSCSTYGCNVADSSISGYWTSSAHVVATESAWYVSSNGKLTSIDGTLSSGVGVRPVITLLKSSL